MKTTAHLKPSEPLLVGVYENRLTVRSLRDETVLKLFIYVNNKCVSTIPDECREVGEELSTFPKKKAPIFGEDIVSAFGNKGINMCRAFLGPSFRDSGTYIPKDDNDEFLIYRCNMGAISMNLPMMWKKSQVEGRDWFEVLDEFMNKIKNIHKRTYNYLCKLKASCNPLVFCEGGFDGGTLNPDESIKPILDKATISFGYGGLHELNMLATGKSTTEDPSFAIATMERINKNVDKFKKQTGILFAIYGTPGESWLPLANEQFVKKYGEVPGIIVKGGYLSNSFHCCVREDITPIEKMNAEAKFWNYSNGGKISHIRINNIENTEGIISLIRYGMSLGLYLGVNHPENHCLDCSCHWAGDDSSDDKDDVCPECGSHNLIKIRRMNGYLSFTRTQTGDTRFHEGKMKEIKERKNM